MSVFKEAVAMTTQGFSRRQAPAQAQWAVSRDASMNTKVMHIVQVLNTQILHLS